MTTNNESKGDLSIAHYNGIYKIVGTVKTGDWELFKNGFKDYHDAKQAVLKNGYSLFDSKKVCI